MHWAARQAAAWANQVIASAQRLRRSSVEELAGVLEILARGDPPLLEDGLRLELDHHESQAKGENKSTLARTPGL